MLSELLAGAAPAATRRGRGYRADVSLAYGDGPRRTLDIYRRDGADRAPVIVFFYGGSWQGGRKETYRFAAAGLARRGFVVAVPDYRVYPEVRFPGFIEDGAAAVRFARDHARRYGGDPARIVLMGHSAGAHIAAMLALEDRWLAAAGVGMASIAGLVGLAGPYDFLPLRSGTLRTIFGGDRIETQPIAHVTPAAPPAFLATGARDRVVDPGNSARLAARLVAAGCDARLRSYAGLGHMLLVAALGLPALIRPFAPVLDDVAAFINSTTTARSSLPAGERVPS
jgi:acetyl esterase/lipase